MISFVEAVLKAKVAQICSHVGFNAITQDSSNILVDIYRRTFIHLARHCKEAANNNRRVEPTLVDLIQAYDFVGISIPELQEHINNVSLPFEHEILKDNSQPSNRIQRDLLVDDQLEAKKNISPDEHDEDGENKLCVKERETDDDSGPPVPLLKDIYQDIAKQFPDPVAPVKADKLRIKREEKPAIPRLKITPLDPAVAEPPSFLPLLDGSKGERAIPVIIEPIKEVPPLELKRGSKMKTKAKVTKMKNKNKTKPKTKTKMKTKPKTKVRGKKQDMKISVSSDSPPHEAQVAVNEPSPTNLHLNSPAPAIKIHTPTPPPPILPPPSKQPTPTSEPSPKIFVPSPPSLQDSVIRTPTPSSVGASASKRAPKGRKKKKKRSSSQFAIVTESVTASAETDDAEWLCPTCNAPDNGDVMVQCDGCDLWFHLKCTGLKKPPEDDEKWECILCIKPKTKLPSSSKKSSKGKKRLKTSHDTYIKVESKTPTPQPPTPNLKQDTPTPPPQQTTSLKPSNEAMIEEATDEASSSRPNVRFDQADDLCPECQLGDDGTLMIQCDDPDCAKWFHGKCVNVLSTPKNDESWFCKLCIEKQQSAFKRRRRVK